jgi:hypothetical protein
MINKKLPVLGVAFLMAVSMGSVYAEEWDMTQELNQERIRSEANLQAAEGDHAQTRTREQKMERQGSQDRNEYRNNNQDRQSMATSGSMTRQGMGNRSAHRNR